MKRGRHLLAVAAAVTTIGFGLAPDAVMSVVAAAEIQQGAASMVAHGVRVDVASLGNGVWRVDAKKVGDAAPSLAPTSADDATGVTVELQDGAIAFRRGDAVLWKGTVTTLDAFGRAKVPGLQIGWEAVANEHLYGLGERFDRLDQAGKRVDLWIEDAPGQGDKSARTYFAAPVVYSSNGYAFFTADNPESVFDLNSAGNGLNVCQRPDDTVTFYVAAGDSLIDLIAKRISVQGAPRSVPEWTWGPWISRNSYESQAEAEEAIKGHLDRGNPVAAIVQEAWKGASETGDFNNWSKDRWPELPAFLSLCREHDIRNVLWQVPVIHPSSPEFKEGREKNYFVKKPDGSISFRKEWLAGFANIDFTNPDAVKWWKDMMRPEVRNGVFGYKADDGEDIKPDDVFFDGRRGWQMHNEFSTLYNKALIELFDEEKVEGILWARSGSLGNHLYPGIWAGDQEATWQQMASLVPAGLSTGLSGMPFWGHDIGGYFGECKPELYTRWLQLGTLSPYMQYHGNKPREPWYFGRDADEAYKLLSRLRMNLKPTLIALGNEAAKTGLPIMRPMAMHYPSDNRFATEDTQFLLGRDLLVAPVLEERAAGRLVKLPEGVWHHALQPMSFQGPAEVEIPVGLVDAPLFVRDGAVLPVQLAEDATLGTWSADAPLREIQFSTERAAISNLKAPLVGDPIERTTRLAFDVSERYAGAITAQWFWADAPEKKHDAKMTVSTSAGRRIATVDLTPPASDKLIGRRQVYILQGSAKPAIDAPQLAFRGEIDWNSPIVLTVNKDDASRVVLPNGGSQRVVVNLRNRSSRPIAARVAAKMSPGATLSNDSQQVTIPPHGTIESAWDVKLAAPQNAIGDTRIAFSVGAKGLDLGNAEAVFTYGPRWVVAGPFKAGMRMAHRTRYPAEWAQSPAIGFDFGGDSIIRWNQLPADHQSRNGGINFAEVFGAQDHAAGFAMTKLRSERDQPVELRMGSDDTLRVWLNGQLVHSIEAYRGAEPDQEIIRTTLKKGLNTIVTKVGQDVAGWEMIFRITGPDGAAIKGVTDGFDSATWNAYAVDRPAATEVVGLPKAYAWRVLGPFTGVPSADSGWVLPSDADATDPTKSDAFREVPTDATPGNRIDLINLLGNNSNCVAYLATDIVVDRDMEATLVSGSDDGLVLWLNGEKVYTAEKPREFNPDSDRVRLRLKAGKNALIGRVSQGGGDWIVQIQLENQAGEPVQVSQRNDHGN